MLVSKCLVVAFQSHGEQAKQGDSDAHDACCRLSECSAVIERGSLDWKERCSEALGVVCWRCTVQPVYRIWASTKDPRAFASALCPCDPAIFCALYYLELSIILKPTES